MKSLVSTTIFAASLAFGSSLAQAQALPSHIEFAADPHQVTQGQVVSGLRAIGYADIGAVTKDGRVYQTTAVWEGNRHALRIDARTGAVADTAVADNTGAVRNASIPADSHDVTDLQVRQALVRAGYGNVQILSRDGQIFSARGDLDGVTADLRVATDTGRITVIGSEAAAPAGLPSPVVIGVAPHKASIAVVVRALGQLGYTSIDNVEKDGRIFSANAVWQGETISLRVDARSGRVSRS